MSPRVREMCVPVGAYLGTLVAIALVARPGAALAQEPKRAERPSPNSATEPLAPVASMARAAAFLDDVSVNWTRQHRCGTCHTNYPYLMARPTLKGADGPAMIEVRRFFEDRVAHWDDEKKSAKTRWDAEVVATAAALAFNDSATTGRLHPLTRRALDRTWTLQTPSGGFDWLKCDWPPYEDDDYYGAIVAALAAGHAPDGYARTPDAQAGVARRCCSGPRRASTGSSPQSGAVRPSSDSARSSRTMAAGASPLWGPGDGTMARPMIPGARATDMPRAWPSSSSARRASR